MDTLTYIKTKYGLELSHRSPIEIPNVGRNDLARLFYLLEFRVGVEVGVERGVYSEVLCRANPLLRLSCVDAWQSYRGYRDHVDQQKLDRFYEQTTERLKPYGATLIRKYSLEAARDVADGSLDFVYIDANHSFANVVNDIAAWSRKVRAGGIVAGHDYIRYHWKNQKARWPNYVQVVEAVHGWTEAHGIEPWFVVGTNAKVDGQVRDESRSWFWVHDPQWNPSGLVRGLA